jgi:hypothetical protein
VGLRLPRRRPAHILAGARAAPGSDSSRPRPRRAVGRAGRLLDLLDGIKIALLEGRIGGDALIRLQGAIREQRSVTDDPRLEALLDEIETRAAVEAAKLEQARAA